jgi:hypothetical protein
MGGRPIAGTKFQQWYFFYTAAFWLYLRHAWKNVRPYIYDEGSERWRTDGPASAEP